MKRDLIWIAALLCITAMLTANSQGPPRLLTVTKPAPERWVSFHVRDSFPPGCFGPEAADVTEVTVIALPEGCYLEAEGVKRKLTQAEYLTLRNQVEADGLWHHNHPDGWPHYSCLAWPLTGVPGPPSPSPDQQKLAEHFFAHPAVQEMTTRSR